VIAHLAAFGGAGDAQADIVTVNGTEAADLITPSVAAGQFTVSGLAASVQVDGFEPANDTVRVQGLGGADVLDASALTAGGPKLVLDGGTQNDTLLGSANGETLIGGDDEDTLVGEGGADFLYGGAGHDTLVGGTGDDQVFGEGGNDRLIWNPGDETDLNEGGNDVDTVEVNGGNGAEEFTATANGTRVRLDRLNPAPFSLDIATCEKLIVNANGGNDRFSATGNLAALIAITADGGAGDDTILGSNGADTLLGGDDNDFVDGNQGFDAVSLGSGNDTFQWDPGDGNDSVEGDLGNDVIVFNGSNIAEAFALSSNGSRVSFTRNVAAIALDANGMEQFDLRMLGGADTLTVNDLTGTGLTLVNLDLAATFSGTTGDGLADVITVNGTVAPDVINVVANAGVVELTGLAAQMRIRNSEPANDNLSINGLGGDDTFNIGNGVTSLIQVTPNQ
jgi:Ca2+-binding RTX toxin-like protein